MTGHRTTAAIRMTAGPIHGSGASAWPNRRRALVDGGAGAVAPAPRASIVSCTGRPSAVLLRGLLELGQHALRVGRGDGRAELLLDRVRQRSPGRVARGVELRVR